MRYKIIRIITLFCLLLALNATCVLAAENTTEFAGGEGTEASPYLIATAEHLNNVRKYNSAHFKMIEDITFTAADFSEGGAFYNGGAGWDPIGKSNYVSTGFEGTFDGNNKTISGLYADGTVNSAGNIGLFSSLGSDGKIQNLTLADSYFTGARIIGGITAYAKENSTIINCHSRSTILVDYTSSIYYGVTFAAGGIAGMATSSSITNCSNTGTITANSDLCISLDVYIGGIVGKVSDTAISNCCNTGDVSASTILDNSSSSQCSAYAGGISGFGSNVTISNCYNSGRISTRNTSYNKISYKSGVGGIIGSTYNATNTASNSTISNCFNIGRLSAEGTGSSLYVGGITGYSYSYYYANTTPIFTTIDACYSTGPIAASNSTAYLHGIAGYTSSSSTITNCYFLDTTCDEEDFPNGTRYTAAEMKLAATFSGFDFNKNWTMEGSEDFPYPELRNPEMVYSPRVSSISVITPPEKTGYFIGDTLCADGIEVSAQYDNGTSASVTDLTYSYDFSTPGKTAVTVIHDGLSTTFDVWVGSAVFSGEGTSASPFLIATTEDLDNMRQYPTSAFKLSKDIIFTEADFAEGGAFYNNGEGFIPIGSYDTPFAGSFDGNGYTITGLYVNPTPKGSDLCAALFYRIQNATIQNLGMVNAQMNAAYGSYTDTYCSYSGTIAAFATSSAITNCYSTGSVSATMRYSHATAYAGGLVAVMEDGGALSGCYNAATVYGKTRAGGLVGYQKSESDQTTISNCFNIGSVSGANLVGGIAGYTDNKKCIVECCYNIGAVSSTSINRACGIVGDVPYYGNTNLFYCYYLDNCSRPVGSGTIDYTVCRYTRDAMLKESSFEGFDFTNIWTMNGHPDYFYPTLRDANMVYTRTLDSISVSSLPDQTMYHIGDTVSTEGLVVTALYDNGLTETVTDYELSYDLSAIGEATVTVTYEGMTTTFTVNVYTNEFQDGFGTEESPYLIATAEQLNNVRNYLDAHFKLTVDIAFTAADFAEGGAYYNNGSGWDPIGTSDTARFNGTFDGNGHTITGLQITVKADPENTQYYEYVGLFEIIGSQGVVCNLGMIDTNISYATIGNYPSVGSIAGRCIGKIINCYSMGNISATVGVGSSGGYFGGLVGRADSSGTEILNCYNITSVDVTARGHVRVGGIAGVVSGMNIENCFNFGPVNLKNIFESTVGGIAGSAFNTTISNCYNAAGSVTGERKPKEGTSDDWQTHVVYVGGIAGAHSNSTFTNCYYLDNCSVGIDDTTTDPCVKCTAEQMQREDTFLGFDFDNVWTMGGNEDYLYPELQNMDLPFTKSAIALSIVTPAKKTLYYTDSELDPTGLSVAVSYNNGITIPVTDYELSYDFSATGKAKVTVSYEGFSDTFTVTVCSREFSGGYGTEDAPYLIATKQQLDAVRKYPNAHYKLSADIIFSEEDFATGGAFHNNGTGFAPIPSFTGSFDGDGHTISGLYINRTSSAGVSAGLFSTVNSALISNLNLENVHVNVLSSSTIYVGGIAGSAVDTPIVNCSCSGSITGTSSSFSSYTGGIVGQTSSEVRLCRNTASVTGSNYVGGIAAKLTGSIVSCYSTGTVTGSNYVGAIIGYCSGGSVTASVYLTDSATNTSGSLLDGAGCNCSNHELFASDDFTSGEAAYYLNKAFPKDTPSWYQTIGKDPLPVLNADHARIYQYQSGGCTEESFVYAYANQEMDAVVSHDFSWDHSQDAHWEVCTYCGHTLPSEQHTDTNSNHICDFCQITVSSCQDSTNDHICDLCGTVCTSCTDENNDHACDICSEVLSDCADTNSDHNCDICGEVLSTCFDSADDADHNCDYCTKVLSACLDNNADHYCDICSTQYSLCLDDNSDHNCDICDVALSVCADTAPLDHLCDVCRAILSNCTDQNTDLLCDVCGADLNKPISISSAAELQKIGTAAGYSRLGTYHLTCDIDLSECEYWTPIGTEEAPFAGVFDGNGHVITGLYINIDSESSDTVYAGLFGVVENGTIRNLGVMNSDIAVKSPSSIYAGSIAGLFRGDGTISGCFNTGNVTVNNKEDTSESIYAGGIAGSAYTGSISNCYNVGTIMMTSDCTGTNRFGQSFAGGIAGYTSASITDCYNAGSISTSIGTMTSFIGGIAGQNISPISSCYNIGTISASGSTIRPRYTGGIVAYSNKRVTNCYYLDTAATSDDGGAIKCTAEQMTHKDTYAGFDFEDVWTMAGLTDYPCPELQNVETHYSKKLVSISITSLPHKAYYDIGDRLDITGMKVTALYDNTATAVVTDYELSYDFSAAGVATVTVTFEGKTADFKVCVNDGLFSGGLGTEQYPYLIGSAEELDQIRNLPFRYYRLITDIVFSQHDFSSGGAFYNSGTGWEPIGNWSAPFEGSFDGDGHAITGLYINLSTGTSDEYAGLFGRVEDAAICNLALRNADISVDTDQNACIGGIVASATSTEIEGCSVSGTLLARSTQRAYAGGIAGHIYLGTISRCSNAAVVIAESNHPKGLSDYDAYAGGILGHSAGRVDVSVCYNIGSVTAESLKNDASAGGILGDGCTTIVNCFNAGTVTAKAYDNGYKSFPNWAFAAGIASAGADTMTCCYNIGEVRVDVSSSTSPVVRGIASYATFRDQVTNCYYVDSLMHGIDDPTQDLTVRCSRWQMTQASTFRGFDFGSVWTMGDSPEYPYPVLKGVEMVSTSLNTSKTDRGVRVALNLMDGLTADEVCLLVAAYDRDGQLCGEAKVYTADALRAFMNGGKEITFSSHQSCAVFLTDLNFKPLLEADFVK